MTMIDTEHVWVKHTITPVHVLDDEGQPVIIVDPDDQDEAEAGAVYGCDRCGSSMADHYGTECEGAED